MPASVTNAAPFQPEFNFGGNASTNRATKGLNRLRSIFDQFTSADVKPEQTKGLLKWGGLFGIGSNLLRGEIFSFDNLLNLAGVACCVPGLQMLVVPVAIGFIAKSAWSLLKGIGCLFKGDIAGFASNILSAGVTALCAFPVGKINKIKELWESKKSVPQFVKKAVELCYGKKEAKSAISAWGKIKKMTDNPGETGKKIYNAAEKARDKVYGFLKPGYKPSSVAAA